MILKRPLLISGRISSKLIANISRKAENGTPGIGAIDYLRGIEGCQKELLFILKIKQVAMAVANPETARALIYSDQRAAMTEEA